jgi:hypothetical protein
MRVSEENKHLIKTSPSQLAATKKYVAKFSEEQKNIIKERLKLYYLVNKEKMLKQRKINYYKKKIANSDSKTIEQLQLESDKKKQKLTEYLENLLQ